MLFFVFNTTVMRSRTFEEMQHEYITDSRFEEDIPERNEMLSKFNYSIIIEGGYLELFELEAWIKLNIGEGFINNIYYPKTGYDFLFSEYFFIDEGNVNKVYQALPDIYTYYPSGRKFKSDGYHNFIDYEDQ